MNKPYNDVFGYNDTGYILNSNMSDYEKLDLLRIHRYNTDIKKKLYELEMSKIKPHEIKEIQDLVENNYNLNEDTDIKELNQFLIDNEEKYDFEIIFILFIYFTLKEKFEIAKWLLNEYQDIINIEVVDKIFNVK